MLVTQSPMSFFHQKAFEGSFIQLHQNAPPIFSTPQALGKLGTLFAKTSPLQTIRPLSLHGAGRKATDGGREAALGWRSGAPGVGLGHNLRIVPLVLFPRVLFGRTPVHRRAKYRSRVSASRSARWLYAVLCSHADKKGFCRRSLKRIAKAEGVSKRAVQNWLNELEMAGRVVRHGEPGRMGFFEVIRHSSRIGEAKASNLQKVSERRNRFAEYGRLGAEAKARGKGSSRGCRRSKRPRGRCRIACYP